MTTLIHITDPFRPQHKPHIERVSCTRLDTQLRRRGLITGRGRQLKRCSRFIVAVNGKWALERDWCRRLGAADVVTILPVVGGGQGSNPMRLLLMVAVIIAAAYTGGAAASAFGSSFAGAAAQMGVVLVGTMLVNAISPLKSSNDSVSSEAARQGYSLQAKGNEARLLDAIPVLYGRHMIYPNYAAQPYSENSGNFQYLYSLYCITQGRVQIEQIRIGDTPISSFSEVQYEVIEPGQAVTLFPDNVVTSGDVATIELQGSNEEGYPADGWYGPFVTSPAQTRANYLGFDITLPGGLVYINDKGGQDARTIHWEFQARYIDDSGNPVGNWFTLDAPSLTMATIDVQMMSYRYAVEPGRFQVRGRRIGEAATDGRTSSKIQWTGLRAYLPSARMYGDVTLLAMVIKATNNVNTSNFQQVNVIGTRILPIWDGSSWHEDVTTSPAWAFADILRNATYGRGFPDKRINLTELKRLADVWFSRGDQFNGVFDSRGSLWDALSDVARAGRAVPMNYGGVVECVRNEPRSIRTAMFTPQNMVRGTFSVSYVPVTYDSPDHVIVEYIDPTTWEKTEVACVLTGSTALTPKRVQLKGITNRDQAWREGITMAAMNRDQRRLPSFSTEREGHLLQYGGRISVSHDMPGWGQSGNVEAFEVGTGLLVLNNDLKWTAGSNHYIALRRLDGSPDGPYLVIPGPDDSSCILAGLTAEQLAAVYVSDGDTEEPTHYVFGPSQETMAMDCTVLSTHPQDDGLTVEVACVNYADSVHLAELDGNPPAPPSPSSLPGIPTAPVVAQVTVERSAQPGVFVISASNTRGANRYEFESSSDGGSSWVQLPGSSQSLTRELSAGSWQVRARAVGAVAGPWAYWAGTLGTWALIPVAPSVGLREPFTNRNVRLEIAGQAGGEFRAVEVYVHSVAPSNFRKAFDTRTLSIDFSYDDARQANAVAPTLVFRVAEGNVEGLGPWSTISVTNPPPPAPSVNISTTAYPVGDSDTWYHYDIAVAAVDEPDFFEYRVRATGSSAVVGSGQAGTYRYDSPLTTMSFDIDALDIWGNVTTITRTAIVPPPPDPGS